MTDETIFRELSGTIAIDTETHDPFLDTWGPGWARPDGGRVLGIVVTDAQRSDYLPIAHNEGVGGNMDKEKVISWLKSQLSKPDLEVIFANAAYDLGWLSTEGIQVKGQVHDILIAAALLDEYKIHNLDSVALDLLGVGKEETKLDEIAKQMSVKNIKQHFARIHPSLIKDYAEQDGRVTFDCWPLLREQLLRPKEVESLDEAEQRKYYDTPIPKLIDCYELERQLIPVLHHMRKNGVRVDSSGVERAARQLRKKEEDYIKEVKRLTGVEIVPTDNTTIYNAMSQYGIQFPMTKKTNRPSITNEFLDSLEEELEGNPAAEVPKMVIRARKISKVRNTFIDPIMSRFVVNGRIHCNLNQLTIERGGTKSGRFSCTSPNLQQQPSPKKDPELGTIVRSMYLPEEGDDWAALDYSAQEPRLTVHYAALLGLSEADKAVHEYNTNPDTDYHTMVANMTGLARSQAKTINLGLAYGMGGAKLCTKLGLPTEEITVRGNTLVVAGEEGRAILEQYERSMPFVSELSKKADVTARRKGFIRTILGRHCRFPTQDNEHGTPIRQFTYRAMNRLIQGSAADQTKKAMVDLYAAGIHLLITVHDEVGISVSTTKETKVAKEIMENCVKLKVPSRVDPQIGKSWGAAK